MSDRCFNSGPSRAKLGKRLRFCQFLAYGIVVFFEYSDSDISMVTKDLLIKFDNQFPQVHTQN